MAPIMLKIAISYRRSDSDACGRIFDRLVRRYGKEAVFRDIDNIPFGTDFRKVVSDALRGTDVLIAIVGPKWRGGSRRGGVRINDENDLVRIEVEIALQRNIPIIPVLVGNAIMPKPVELPQSLREFSFRNAASVDSGRNFDADVKRLMHSMDRLFRGGAAESGRVESIALTGSKRPKAVAIKQSKRPIEARGAAERRTEGRIQVGAKIIHGAPDGWFKPGAGKVEWFQDHEHGPEMVVVPAGEFIMGSPENEPERVDAEGPMHQVKLANPFSVGRHAVTRGQFAAFVNNTNYKMEGGAYTWRGSKWKHDANASWCNPGFHQDDNHPVVCVNWNDARAYVAWLSEATERTYRLPSEAEWEYVARAGTTTPFWWGSSITPVKANYDCNYVYKCGGSKGKWRKSTLPVGNFRANPWGLYNVHGNVWEWCEDIWHDNYNGAPANGLAWLHGGDGSRHIRRGGSWNYSPEFLRSANRFRYASSNRNNHMGFRLARTLTNAI